MIPQRLAAFKLMLNIATANTIVNTCLTLARMWNLHQPPLFLLGKSLSRPKLTGHSHGQSRRLFVRGETNHIESERDGAVEHERDGLVPRHLRRAVNPHAIQLARDPAEEHALDERERGHADQKFERVKLEPPNLHTWVRTVSAFFHRGRSSLHGSRLVTIPLMAARTVPMTVRIRPHVE